MIPPPPARPLPHQLFEQQVLRTPGNIAAVCGHESLTFQALNDRANDLAGRLAGNGVGTGDYVGIGLPRSLDLLIALLGILKAGAAYIPVDPSYPAERIPHMIASSGMRMMVTDSAQRPAFGDTPVMEIRPSPDATVTPPGQAVSQDGYTVAP